MRNYVLSLLILVGFTSCKNEQARRPVEQSKEDVLSSYWLEKQENRKNYLKLAGLLKLEDGEHVFGNGSGSDIDLNLKGDAFSIGRIKKSGDNINFSGNPDMKIMTVTDSVITDLPLSLDDYGNSTKLVHDNLSWRVITRSGSNYIRVWDEKNPMLEKFKGFERYAYKPEFKLKGLFTYFDQEVEEEVQSQLGVGANTKFIGKVSFSIEGKPYELDVGQNGFTMVNDLTSGDNTYGGGRYIYLDLPETDGEVEIDMNRLYNPPCSFSAFTTCLYPPRQNHLAVEIDAGETIKRL